MPPPLLKKPVGSGSSQPPSLPPLQLQPSTPAMSDDPLVSDVQRKIDRERALVEGAQRMRLKAAPSMQSSIDNQIREGRRNIEYLEGTMRELQMRRMGQGVGNMSLEQSNGGPTNPGSAPGTKGQGAYKSGQQPRQGGFGKEGADYGDAGLGGYSELNNQHAMPARAPFGPPGPGGVGTKGRPGYSRLDLIKYDTPHLGARIQLMLSQLEFKLSVEKQYEEGIKKIMGSYNMEGDRKVRAEAHGKRIESMQKIQLLQRALKHYEDLHVDMDTTADLADDDSVNGPSMRKPLTGLLSLRIHAVSDVTHAAPGRLSRGPETFVVIKVEDEFKGRTKASRTDKWTDELHEIDIDKGNEVELTVYDKGAGDHPMPIGMLWIRISDIAEEMRRKRIETEFTNSGWVSADRTVEDGQQTRPDTQFSPPPNQPRTSGSAPSGTGFGAPGPHQQAGPVVIDSWFSLEPIGRIQLTMSFSKQTIERRPFDAGLNRKGAIRQRKEDVHELYGHKFVAQQFYNIMRCALCGELLKYSTGMQCSDCKYLCHEKCYPLVVTKCISQSNTQSDPDEAKLNHRIPHRFEIYGNISANWCCHCGYMLPLGRKNVKRCKECKLTCHAHCTHLVPDFCGMSMKDANRILGEIKFAQARQGSTRRLGDKTLRAPGREPKPRPAPSTQPSYVFGSEAEQKKTGRFSYGNEQSSDSQSQSSTGISESSVVSMAKYSYAAGPSTQLNQQRRPPPTRSETSQSSIAAAAAAAAANALAGKRGAPISPSEARVPFQGRTQSFPISQDRIQTTTQPPPQHAEYDPSRYADVDKYGMPPPQQSSQQVSSKPGYNQIPPQVIEPISPITPPPQSTLSQPPLVPPPSSTSISQTLSQTSPVDKFVEQPPQPPPTQQRGSGRRIGLDHFNFLAVLGKGNFGKVMLAETKATKQLYAIKVLKKEFIIENDEVESTKSERDVFIIANKARHPFLLNLHACFQTETRVYFVMEYISGGDLMLHIQRGTFGTKRAQFYAAEVCLALKYFHENGVVYRDLKLDNIMLTLDGHIKVADYGLCKKDMYYGSTTSTFCGTPEFMAPEILLDKKYGRAVDWWAFGVLIYQMLLQQSPFRGEDEDEIYDAILSDEPLYPIHMPRDSVSILQKLLTREPEARLGSGPTDAQEIMSHAFFRTINWEDVYHKRMPAPFLPQIKSPTDTSNFDQEFTSVTPVLTPVQSVLTIAMQEEFKGFSYSADFV